MSMPIILFLLILRPWASVLSFQGESEQGVWRCMGACLRMAFKQRGLLDSRGGGGGAGAIRRLCKTAPAPDDAQRRLGAQDLMAVEHGAKLARVARQGLRWQPRWALAAERARRRPQAGQLLRRRS
jgi:hypothetical protein